MADMLPGAPGVAELLRRAAAGLEDPCGTDRLRAAWDDGARRAAAWCPTAKGARDAFAIAWLVGGFLVLVALLLLLFGGQA